MTTIEHLHHMRPADCGGSRNGDGGTHLVPSSPAPCAPGCGICLLSAEVDR